MKKKLEIKDGISLPTQKQLDALLGRIIQCLIRILERDGWFVVDAQQPWLDLHDADPLDNLNAASIRYSIALGPGQGNRTLTIHNPTLIRPDQPTKTLTSNQNGFSLKVAVACSRCFQSKTGHKNTRRDRPCMDNRQRKTVTLTLVSPSPAFSWDISVEHKTRSLRTGFRPSRLHFALTTS